MNKKFYVLTAELPACYGLEVGTPLLKVASTYIAPGGYEMETYQRLDHPHKGETVDVRVDHRVCFTEFDVDGKTEREIAQKMAGICAAYRSMR